MFLFVQQQKGARMHSVVPLNVSKNILTAHKRTGTRRREMRVKATIHIILQNKEAIFEHQYYPGDNRMGGW